MLEWKFAHVDLPPERRRRSALDRLELLSLISNFLNDRSSSFLRYLLSVPGE